MAKSCLKVLLILFLLLSCKKVTDPIGESNGINGTWQETYTWYNYLECLHPEDDSSNCMITQTSILNLNTDEFTVQISPKVNSTFDIFDTLYKGTFWIESDTILFELDNGSSIQKMSYQLNGDSLKMVMVYDSPDGRITIIPSGSFMWGNALLKLAGTFYRKK
ncbi:MAG: hypothetical protein KAV45_10730 [Calditrichia bacterium]|nr:hypothetical protein [Calditrichia bacterium]